MNDSSDIAALLQRTNELLSILVKAQISPVLQRELAKDVHRKLYDLTGKAVSVKDISTQVGLSRGTISTVWNRWEELGLLVKDKGRYRRVLE